MDWIYTAVVRPMVAYGSVVWNKCCNLKTYQTKLGKLNRTVCMLITGCMKSTPNAALEIALNIEPLDLFVQRMAHLTEYRLKSANLVKKTCFR